MNQRTDFKYRIYDLYGLNYIRLSCFEHMREKTEDSHDFDPESVLEKVKSAVLECDLAGPSKYNYEDLEDFFIKQLLIEEV